MCIYVDFSFLLIGTVLHELSLQGILSVTVIPSPDRVAVHFEWLVPSWYGVRSRSASAWWGLSAWNLVETRHVVHDLYTDWTGHKGSKWVPYFLLHIVTILLPSNWHIFQEDSQCLLMSRRRVGLQSIHLFTWTGRQFPSKLRISLSVHTSNGTLLDEEMNIYGICDRPLTYPSARRSNLGLRIVCQLPQCAQQDGASRQSLML